MKKSTHKAIQRLCAQLDNTQDDVGKIRQTTEWVNAVGAVIAFVLVVVIAAAGIISIIHWLTS